MTKSALDQPARSIARSELVIGERNDTLRTLAYRMHEANCSALLVANDDSYAIVTERDIVDSLASGASPDEEWAVDVMTRDVQSVQGSATIADVAELMQVAGIRHVLVDLDDGAVGVVSVRDLLEPLLLHVSSK